MCLLPGSARINCGGVHGATPHDKGWTRLFGVSGGSLEAAGWWAPARTLMPDERRQRLQVISPCAILTYFYDPTSVRDFPQVPGDTSGVNVEELRNWQS
jgi:hypothetical protein